MDGHCGSSSPRTQGDVVAVSAFEKTEGTTDRGDVESVGYGGPGEEKLKQRRVVENKKDESDGAVSCLCQGADTDAEPTNSLHHSSHLT